MINLHNAQDTLTAELQAALSQTASCHTLKPKAAALLTLLYTAKLLKQVI